MTPDNKIPNLLSEIAENIEKLTAWEQEFVESISDQLDRGHQLSQKQIDIVSRIHEQRVLDWK